MWSQPHYPVPRTALGTEAFHARRQSSKPYVDLMTRRRRKGPYELDQGVARRYYSEPPQTSYKLSKPISLDEATINIVKHLDENSEHIGMAIRQERKQFLEYQTNVSDVLKHFARFFDAKIFLNRLRGHVNLELDDIKGHVAPDNSGRTAVSPNASKIKLAINTPLLEAVMRRCGPDAGIDHMLAILLHQFIHAYFMVACGIQTNGKDPDGRLKHEEHFGCLMYKIKSVFNNCSMPIPLDFGHFLPYMPLRAGEHSQHGIPRNALIQSIGHSDGRKHCTECLRDVESIKEEKINDWYKKKCIKAVDPDIYIFDFQNDTEDSTPSSKCGKKEDWVEVVHNKKPYKLDRKIVKRYKFLEKQFADDKRKLEISSSVDPDVFKSMMSFLIRARWSPDLSESHNDTQGPPLLLEYYHNAPNYVQHDIAVYQLGQSLGFDDLRVAALQRLSSHHYTNESGHDIVRAIYYDTQPDEPLRKWAREFFMRYSEPKPGCKPIDASNWKNLNNDVVFQAGILGTNNRNLIIDLGKAENNLRKMKKAEPKPEHICTVHCHPGICGVAWARAYSYPYFITHSSPPAPPLPLPLHPVPYSPPTDLPPPPPPPSTFRPTLTCPSSIYSHSFPHVMPPAEWSSPQRIAEYMRVSRDQFGRLYSVEEHAETWNPFDYQSSHPREVCVALPTLGMDTRRAFRWGDVSDELLALF